MLRCVTLSWTELGLVKLGCVRLISRHWWKISASADCIRKQEMVY